MKAKRRKFYVQNGFNKRIWTARNEGEAATFQLKYLLADSPENQGQCDLSPLTLVSERGYQSDIMAVNPKMIDDLTAIRTRDILVKIGRKDIATEMKKREKSLPPEVRRLLAAI